MCHVTAGPIMILNVAINKAAQTHPITCTGLLSAAAPVEAAKRRADNLTWFQAPLINSSSDKATALTTSVVAEGLCSLKRLQHAGGRKKRSTFHVVSVSQLFFNSLKTFKVVVTTSVNL